MIAIIIAIVPRMYPLLFDNNNNNKLLILLHRQRTQAIPNPNQGFLPLAEGRKVSSHLKMQII